VASISTVDRSLKRAGRVMENRIRLKKPKREYRVLVIRVTLYEMLCPWKCIHLVMDNGVMQMT